MVADGQFVNGNVAPSDDEVNSYEDAFKSVFAAYDVADDQQIHQGSSAIFGDADEQDYLFMQVMGDTGKRMVIYKQARCCTIAVADETAIHVSGRLPDRSEHTADGQHRRRRILSWRHLPACQHAPA